ncbi:MAG: DegV family protein [Corallococcus sp.]|nr:DegV family protein [Bacillota bacterium]MCM1533427.1 DegV family protein [Corallococcus sp.]
MFILTCESTADIPLARLNERNIPVIPYTYCVNGIEYVDDMGEFDGRKQFYKLLAQGEHPTTSLICVDRYVNFFREQLNKGDLLHIAFDSGLSQSVYNAFYAAEELKKEFPDRRIMVIDSTCGCVGYGVFVDMLADMRDAGKSFDEIYDWAKANRTKVHHQFFSTTLSYLRKSGRVSGPAANVGSLLKTCPVFHLNKSGKIIAYARTMGVTKAIAKTMEEVSLHVENGENYDGRMWIAHSDCADTANKVTEKLKTAYPKADVQLFEIGPVIGSHCGKGTVSVYFMGDERAS